MIAVNWLYVGAGVLVFGAGYGLANVQSTAAIAKLQRDHEQAIGKIIKERDDATQQVRATEKKLNVAAHKTKEFHETQLAEREIIIAGLRTAESYQRAAAVELRRDLQSFLARRAAADPACPSDPRAATLGTLLEDALDVSKQNDATAREIAEGAERHAGEIRTLKKYVQTVCHNE